MQNELDYDESLMKFSGRAQNSIYSIMNMLGFNFIQFQLDTKLTFYTHLRFTAAKKGEQKVHSLEKKVEQSEKVIYSVMNTQIIQVTINVYNAPANGFDDDASSSPSSSE